jgi:hypothetical protein
MIRTLQSGAVTKLLDALTSTADTKSATFAIPPSVTDLGRAVTWQSIPVVNPDAISLQLQGAMNNVDAEFAVLDTSTVVGGEMKTVAIVNLRFLRVRQVSRTNGTSITVQVEIQ